MERRLKTVKQNDDFGKIKKDGYGGVIFAEKSCNEELFRDAKKQRLKTFLHIGNFRRKKCLYLEPDGAVCGELYAVMPDSVERAAENMKDLLPLLDGFVIPVPELKGLLWQENFEKEYEDFSGRDFREDMPLIFDKDAESADIRLWCYVRATETMFRDVILPLHRIAEKLGKKICVDFGNAPSVIKLIQKQVSPYMFLNNGIAVIYENDERIVLVSKKSRTKEVLLVLPMCSVMRYMAWGAPYSRMESPLSVAVAEEEYYKAMLKRHGLQFDAVDELEFSEMKKKELEKYKNILICDSCMITDTDRLNGLNVNDEKLLELFDKGN